MIILEKSPFTESHNFILRGKIDQDKNIILKSYSFWQYTFWKSFNPAVYIFKHQQVSWTIEIE